jgi:hypothetical protein
MNFKQLSLALPALLLLGGGAAKAGQTINEMGAIACVNDKWDVKEPEKGHKLVDYAGRCINVPDDAAAPKSTADCQGSTSTCLMKVGRAAGPALTPIRAGTRST